MTDFIDALVGTLETPPSGSEASLQAGVTANVVRATDAEAKTQAGGEVLSISAARAQILAGTAPVAISAGATWEPAADDNNKIVGLSHSAGVTVTLPEFLPAGFGLSVFQAGAGPVTFQAAAGASIRQIDGLLSTRGQYACCALTVISNAGGAAAEWLLVGDMT